MLCPSTKQSMMSHNQLSFLLNTNTLNHLIHIEIYFQGLTSIDVDAMMQTLSSATFCKDSLSNQSIGIPRTSLQCTHSFFSLQSNILKIENGQPHQKQKIGCIFHAKKMYITECCPSKWPGSSRIPRVSRSRRPQNRMTQCSVGQDPVRSLIVSRNDL